MRGLKLALAAIVLACLTVWATVPTDALLSSISVESVSWSPKKPQPDDTMTFSVVIKNTLNSQIKIKWIGVHFDWMLTNDYIFEDHTSSPIVVQAQSTWTFSFLVTLPTNTTFASHPYHLKVDYIVGSSSYNEKSDTYYDFSVQKVVPIKEPPMWQNPIVIIALILVLVVVALVAVLVVVRKRRLAAELARKPLEMKGAVTTDQTPGECEFAQTVTKQPRLASQQKSGARPWAPSHDQRILGQPSKPPLYKFLGPGKGKNEPTDSEQTMPQTPPPVQMPSQLPTTQPSGPPVQMPGRPPPQVMPQSPPSGIAGTPPPLPPQVPKDHGMLHQCPICGKMNKATDTTCPRCGGNL